MRASIARIAFCTRIAFALLIPITLLLFRTTMVLTPLYESQRSFVPKRWKSEEKRL